MQIASVQRCSPRERGLGLESTYSRPILCVLGQVLVLRGKVLVLISGVARKSGWGLSLLSLPYPPRIPFLPSLHPPSSPPLLPFLPPCALFHNAMYILGIVSNLSVLALVLVMSVLV